MLNNVKDIILKNKYAILVLLILSLWLRLVNGYNILLSYIILLILYVVVGIGVQIVLEKFFPGWISNEKHDNKKNDNKKEQVAKPATREARYDRQSTNNDRADRYQRNRYDNNVDENNSVDKSNRENKRYNSVGASQSETRKERGYSHSSTYTRDIPRREDTGVREKDNAYTKIERPSPVKTMPELRKTSPAPKVTSSYVKNAGGMSYDMEKKLVKTSADFGEIRKESDHYANVERQRERLYNASRSAIVGNNRDLYTNKRENKDEVQLEAQPKEENKHVEIKSDKAVERTSKFEKISPTFANSEESETDYTPIDYAKESEELKNEVEKRIADSSRTTRRPIKVLEYDDTSFAGYNEPVRRKNIQIPRETVTPTPSNVNKNIVLGKQPEEKPVNTRKVHVATIETSDKVDADIDKINKLFDKDGNNEPKKGLFSRFKKKRR